MTGWGAAVISKSGEKGFAAEFKKPVLQCLLGDAPKDPQTPWPYFLDRGTLGQGADGAAAARGQQ